MEDTNSLIKVRKDKIKEIREEFGINPFPYNYDVTDFSSEIKENFDQISESETVVSVAGRITAQRVMGKASFCTISDKKDKIQLYVAMKNIGEEKYSLFKKLDLGDIIGVKGIVKKTKVGEITIYINELTLLTKNIRPLPIVKEKDGETFDAFADKELRYRNRHVDLLVTNGVKETFIKRINIIKNIKAILDNNEFLEVETPTLQPIYGGASASPFTSHHNALDITLYMRISLEPYLKRLIVGGLDRVYEIGKCFRNEGIDRTHNPEFTMLELYQSYADYTDMMELTENIFEKTALKVNGSTKVEFDGNNIDLQTPWKKIKMVDAIKEYANLDIESMSDDELKAEIFELLVEDKLIQPTQLKQLLFVNQIMKMKDTFKDLNFS